MKVGVIDRSGPERHEPGPEESGENAPFHTELAQVVRDEASWSVSGPRANARPEPHSAPEKREFRPSDESSSENAPARTASHGKTPGNQTVSNRAAAADSAPGDNVAAGNPAAGNPAAGNPAAGNPAAGNASTGNPAADGGSSDGGASPTQAAATPNGETTAHGPKGNHPASIGNEPVAPKADGTTLAADGEVEGEDGTESLDPEAEADLDGDVDTDAGLRVRRGARKGSSDADSGGRQGHGGREGKGAARADVAPSESRPTERQAAKEPAPPTTPRPAVESARVDGLRGPATPSPSGSLAAGSIAPPTPLQVALQVSSHAAADAAKAAPPPAAALPSPSLQELQQMREASAFRVAQVAGGNEANVELNHPSLGQFRFAINLERRALALRVHAPSVAAAAALKASEGSLRSSIAEQGVRLRRMRVSVVDEKQASRGKGRARPRRSKRLDLEV